MAVHAVGTNRPAGTRGWLGQAAYLGAAHRVHARVETSAAPGAGWFHGVDLALFREPSYHAMTRQDTELWADLGTYRAGSSTQSQSDGTRRQQEM